MQCVWLCPSPPPPPSPSTLYCIYMPEFQLNRQQLNVLRHSSYHSTKLTDESKKILNL